MNSLKNEPQEITDVYETKLKRDQYVLEIRKQKVEDILKAKRLKLSETYLKNQGMGIIDKQDEFTFVQLTSLFFEAVQKNDETMLLDVIRKIRSKLSNSQEPPLQDFIESGLFTHIIKFLAEEYKEYEDLQYEALWVISNSLTGTPEQCQLLINDDLLKDLVRYIRHPAEKMQSLTFWVLANACGDFDEVRMKMLDLGVIDEIAKFFKCRNQFSDEMCRNIIWLIDNLVLLNKSYEKFLPIFPYLQMFLRIADIEIKTKTAHVYAILSNIKNELLGYLINPQSAKGLIELMNAPDAFIQTSALRAVGNILAGKEEHAKKLIDAGVLVPLETFLSHRRHLVRRDALWAISNAISENEKQLGKLFQTDIFDKIQNILILDNSLCKIEALYCIANTLSIATIAQFDVFNQRYSLPKLLKQAICNENEKVVLCGLDCIEIYLKRGEVMKSMDDLDTNPSLDELEEENVSVQLELLQNHKSEEVYKKVSSIIDTFFQFEVQSS